MLIFIMFITKINKNAIFHHFKNIIKSAIAKIEIQ